MIPGDTSLPPGFDHPHASEEARRIAEAGMILRVQVGSGVHGTSITGQDDRDEMGICLESSAYVTGLARVPSGTRGEAAPVQLEQYQRHTVWDQPGGLANRSGAGDLDVVVYSARKWASLALAGNPTVLLVLFVPDEEVVAKALELIKAQYASVGAAARHVLSEALSVLEAAASRGLDVGALTTRTEERLANAHAFRDAYAAYVRPTDGLDGITLAPFQVLAAEGRALAVTESHEWHLDRLAGLVGDVITPTRHRYVDLSSREERDAATQWWLDLTAAGGEGMVVKPAHLTEGRVQPGIKVRGREYLRIIYGPDYTGSLDVLRQRHLGKKRQLAAREHGLGLDAIAGFVAGDPLWKVHQAVFAVLALESEPVDPRL